MEVPLINIGNSKGIILSKTLLEKYGLGKKIQIIMKEDRMEILAVRPPRAGWDKAFREMHESGDDVLLLGEFMDDDLLEEWNWDDGADTV